MIAGIWREVLKVETVGVDDNFFELGGHSLLLVRAHGRLEAKLGRKLTLVELFQYPTISRLAEHLSGSVEGSMAGVRERAAQQGKGMSAGVAVIGMVGRFPGAGNLEEFWENLAGGVESITFFSEEELLAAGVAAETLRQPEYVKARGVLAGADLFDAGFFGYSPREAELMDPQQRLFLENAWEALEEAGYEAEGYGGVIGVYAGMSVNSYVLNLLSHPELVAGGSGYQMAISSGGDYLSTRVSYKLNLRGPSVTVQTACSTSLVAVHMACRSLLNGECDVALAGGVSVSGQPRRGYYYQAEGISSPDGHCRAFDARAQGTVGGNGVGVVVLKRLAEAVADGDTIRAVIRGTATNNDGSLKVGYTAPSVRGQAEVIALAQAVGGVEARSINYVEAHGTGTVLGDPIEIEALKEAFRLSTAEKGFCRIGSVKSNIGHLDAAAGVAGLIKTVLALEHGKIPASLNYEAANPKIDFADSPFCVNRELREWGREGGPRRAGVSSFGIGGSNAHAVLEEAPAVEGSGPSRTHQVWVLSARTEAGLERATENLIKHLKREARINMADGAYTLQVGRKAFMRRRVVVSRGREEAIGELERLMGQGQEQAEREPGVVFLFSGQGAQYEGMGWGIYQQEGVFRAEVDRCSEQLRGELGMDLRGAMYPGGSWGGQEGMLRQTWLAQPALFVVEYALAKLWGSWGIEPEAMLGHSIGEYVAACLAGVFTVEEGLKLVAERGRLMQGVGAGLMISVELSEGRAREMLVAAGLGGVVSVAAVNGPELSVLSGPMAELAELELELERRGVSHQRLETSHAFHSGMMEGVVERFVEAVKRVRLREPEKRYISNVSGKWIRPEEARDPAYWGRHLLGTVRFSEGVEELLKAGTGVWLEVGPGRTLGSLVKQQAGGRKVVVEASLRHRAEGGEDEEKLLKALGGMWQSGVKVKWADFYQGERRHRIRMPTYPFERQRYWVEARASGTGMLAATANGKRKNIDEWCYMPSWKQMPLKEETGRRLVDRLGSWLVLFDGGAFSTRLVTALRSQDQRVVLVHAGQAYKKRNAESYEINIREAQDYRRLLRELGQAGLGLRNMLHLWLLGEKPASVQADALEQSQMMGFYSLLYLAQAIGEECPQQKIRWKVITSGIQQVTGLETITSEKATVLGPCRVAGLEYPNLTSSHIDIEMPAKKVQQRRLLEQLLAELSADEVDFGVAYRGGYRWTQSLEPTPLKKLEGPPARLRHKGVYLITGGLGGIGLVLAEYLAETVQARLALTGRSGLPERGTWEEWLVNHETNDPVSAKIRKVRSFESMGAEVMILSADVSDETQMRAALGGVYERYGKIHGVVHSAGLSGGGIMQLRQREEVEQVFAPKVKGTLILGKIFAKKKLDFFVLCSSLTSGGAPAQVDYCSANAFLDAYAHAADASWRATSVNWDSWQEVGMAANTQVPDRLDRLRRRALETGILPAEGKEVFHRILNSFHPQILISTKALFIPAGKLAVGEADGETVSEGDNHERYKRPELGSDYVAPGNETEQKIAKIWEKLLGVSNPGIHDNFFELGGHSLVAIQLISRLREAFGVELPLRIVFENPTIAGLGGFTTWVSKGKQAAASSVSSNQEEGLI
jgi:acyl transferase domain-containing protein/acyl carrier protein